MHQLPTGTVTLLFTDVEGSTRLLQQLGDRYAEVLSECRRLLRTAFQQSHGYEVDTQGDSFLVAFARASDAVMAAVQAQRMLAAHAWPQGGVRVRMGLHTGEPKVAAEGYVGLDVHRAARIMSAGHGGQILLSQTTCDLVEQDLPNGSSLRDLGAHRLKDLEHPTHLYQLVIEGLPADFPPLETLDRHPHNLPVQPTSFIGREREVVAVGHLLEREDVRLLTLTGPGGSGKTRLGLQAAAELSDEFADGVFFVNLAPISDPDLVVPTMAQVLGLKEAAGQASLDALGNWLREKAMLLLLDNFEQVVAAAIEVAALLASTPRLKMLVTSRAALHVRGEHEFAVPPLALPDPHHIPDLVMLSHCEAVALFIGRAQAVNPAFEVTTTNAAAVAELCVHLDGLPLAIELAAARIKLLPPQALLGRLSQRFSLLTGGAHDAPARQQTLRNTIAWSYDLLDAAEQRLFRRLCVFAGGATQQAIEAISLALGDEPGLVLDDLASLIDKSLLRQAEQETEEPRYVMLETLREYGREMLTCRGEMQATCQAHAGYYLALAEAAELGRQGPLQGAWFARLEQEHDNLRAAMSWLLERREAELALRLGTALRWFWFESGSFHEGWNFLDRTLEGGEEVALPLRAKALWTAGQLACFLNRSEQAEAFCQQSLALFRAVGDTAGMARATNQLACAAQVRGDFAAARSRFEESLILAREAGNQPLLAEALEDLAQSYMNHGEFISARPLLEESLALSRALGRNSNFAWTLHYLAILLFLQSDLARAHTVAEECVTLNKEIGSKFLEAEMLWILGEIALYQGDTTAARLLLEQSREFYREMGNEGQFAWMLVLLGKVLTAQGDLVAARALYEESLMPGKEVHSNLVFVDLPPALEGVAAVVAAQGEALWAARLWGTAEALREGYGTPLAPVYRADYNQAVAAARSRLGEPALAAAWAEGRNMTADQVLFAREPLSRPEPVSSAKLPPASSSPNDLTPREIEVLRLIAAGSSNQDIADQLVISERTVNSHLVHIFNKLGVNSRAAAAAFAIRHKLAD